MSSPLIIDGKKIAAQVKETLKPRIAALKSRGITPGLAVVLVGEDPGSAVYVRMKARAFKKLGLFSETIRLPQDTSQSTLLETIEHLNKDARFHGILVQLPLPTQLDETLIIEAIDPEKDADGIHPRSLGGMLLGIDGPLPCTPHGILMLLQYSKIDPDGKHVVILGRSNIVGKPISNLLALKKPLGNATVTLCHSHTADLAAITRQADILIAAIGRPAFVKCNFLKRGAVVIDVGVNRVADPDSEKGYRLVGDVDYAGVRDTVGAITPVPGGVGPMTITMLIANTVYLAEKRSKH